jgi:ribose transport system permease protein
MTATTSTSTALETPPAERGKERRPLTSVSGILERFGLVGLLIILVAVFAVQLPGVFLSGANLRSIALSQSVLAVMAVALVFPLVGGRFDISVGANLGLCSIVTASMMSKTGLPLLPSILIGVATGVAIGAINGILVAYLGINSIIATLGVSTIIAGIVQAYTQGIPVSSNISPALTGMSNQLVLGIPVLFILMLVLAAAAWFVLTQTTYGRYLFAVGSNADAATLVGLPIRRIILMSFVWAGGFAGIAGVLQVAAQGNGNPQVGGITFMLPALAAVFLGATTFTPGKYNIPGTVLGLIFIATAVSGLALMGVQPWVTDVFNGGAVVVAVGLSALFKRRRTGTAALGE